MRSMTLVKINILFLNLYTHNLNAHFALEKAVNWDVCPMVMSDLRTRYRMNIL